MSGQRHQRSVKLSVSGLASEFWQDLIQITQGVSLLSQSGVMMSSDEFRGFLSLIHRQRPGSNASASIIMGQLLWIYASVIY